MGGGGVGDEGEKRTNGRGVMREWGNGGFLAAFFGMTPGNSFGASEGRQFYFGFSNFFVFIIILFFYVHFVARVSVIILLLNDHDIKVSNVFWQSGTIHHVQA